MSPGKPRWHRQVGGGAEKLQALARRTSGAVDAEKSGAPAGPGLIGTSGSSTAASPKRSVATAERRQQDPPAPRDLPPAILISQRDGRVFSKGAFTSPLFSFSLSVCLYTQKHDVKKLRCFLSGRAITRAAAGAAGRGPSAPGAGTRTSTLPRHQPSSRPAGASSSQVVVEAGGRAAGVCVCV